MLIPLDTVGGAISGRSNFQTERWAEYIVRAASSRTQLQLAAPSLPLRQLLLLQMVTGAWMEMLVGLVHRKHSDKHCY